MPGALEIPPAIATISQQKSISPYIGYVALGCVIRGETSHYDIVSNESARGLDESKCRARASYWEWHFDR